MLHFLRAKKWALLIPLILIVATFSLRDSILSVLVQWQFKNFCQECLGGELQDKGIVRRGNTIIIDHPHLDLTKPLDQGGHHFSAKQITITHQFSLLKREVDVWISVNEPKLVLGMKADELSEAFKEWKGREGYFQVNAYLNSHDGIIEYVNKDGTQEDVHVSMEFNGGVVPNGWIDLALQGGSDDGHLVCKLFREEEGLNVVNINFNKIDASKLCRLWNVLDSSEDGLQVQSGYLNGQASVQFSKKIRPRAQGEVVLSQFSFVRPGWKLAGEIPEISLRMNETKSDNEPIGLLNFSQEFVLRLEGKNLPHCEVNQLTGSLALLDDEKIKVTLTGNCQHHDQTFDLVIDGEALYPMQAFASFDLNVSLTAIDIDEIGFRFLGRGLEKGLSVGQLDIRNFRREEFELLKLLLGKHARDLDFFTLHEGRIDASLIAYVKEGKLDDLAIDKIAAKDLYFDIDSWDLSASVGQASGSMKISLNSANIFDTLDAELMIQKGQLFLGALESEGWQFRDISTQLVVRQGSLQKSLVEAVFAGLEGSIEMDWASLDNVMKMHFQGGTNDLALMMPAVLRQGFERKFAQDHLEFNAVVKRSNPGLSLEGVIDIINPSQNDSKSIHLGFDLCKTSEQLWGVWPPSPFAGSYYTNLHREVMQSIVPAMIKPVFMLQTDWMKEKYGVAGLVLHNGWFKAKNIPMDKYIAPFVFSQDQFVLTGSGDFEGNFDGRGLTVRYVGKDVVLENPHLSIEVAMSQPIDGAVSNAKGTGVHYFDFEKGVNFGDMSIADGVYFEKNSGLFFTNVKTEIALEGQKMHVTSIETFCNDVYFSGAMEVDYSYPEPGFFDVEVYTHTMNGKVSRVRELFSHFERPLMLADMPLEGNLNLRKPGGFLRFAFDPDDFTLQAKIIGTLTDGTLECLKGDTVVHDLGLNFEYDHAARLLNLEDIQGAVLLGKGDSAEDYALNGSYIRFKDVVKSDAEFNIAFGDKENELVRLAGHTRLKQKDKKQGVLQFFIDKELTHFGGEHPSILELVLLDCSHVDKFHLELAFKLNTVVEPFKKLLKTGVFLDAPMLASEMNSLEDAKGDFHVDLRYDRHGAQFLYNLKGTDIIFGKYSFQKCILNGKKKDSTWAIEQLQLGDLSVAADILKEENRWIFNFLGIRWGKSLLLGMEGEYVENNSTLNAQVNLLEMDMGKIEDWPALKSFAQKYNPKGDLRATGSVRLELGGGPQGWKADALLNTSLRSFEMMGLPFQDIENASCHFVSDSHMTFRQINSALKSSTDASVQGLLSIEKLEFNFAKDEVSFDGIHFNAPAENLGWLAKNLQERFPEQINDTVADTIHHIKRVGNLKGNLSLHLTPKSHQLRLELPEGQYWWLDREHDVNNFTLTHDPKELKIVAQYRYQQHPFWLLFNSQTPSLNTGRMIFSNHLPNHDKFPESAETLVVDWTNRYPYGFIIHKAYGVFAGLGINLTEDRENPATFDDFYLVGDVTVDINKASRLVSAEFRNNLASWEIGKGYFLRGKWRWNKKTEKGSDDYLTFKGMLGGQDVEFKGYQFDRLSANLNYSSDSIYLQDLNVEDASGRMNIDRMVMSKRQPGDQWTMNVGRLTIKDFRPSLLKEAGAPPPIAAKPLIIRELVVENFYGNMADASSFVGEGKLHFTNKTKKVLHNPLFVIPSEILNRLGLDLAVLNPVTGSILFNVQGGKVHLTKFKDMYSDGKLSKFYLPNSSHEAYMDFAGNLNLQVRMKQYNLLFKLAELFTVTIRGHIQKPTYSLQKQRNNENTTIGEN